MGGGGGGGRGIGNINIIWKEVHDVNHGSNMAQTVLSANSKLPEYHTRQMQKDFMRKCKEIANINASGLNEIYQELTGDKNNTIYTEIELWTISNKDEGLFYDL